LFIRCITFHKTISPTRTTVSKWRLKSSGRRSNPFKGESLEKKISGPPYAITNNWDSTFADAHTCEGVLIGMMGRIGSYFMSLSIFLLSLSLLLGLRGSSILLSRGKTWSFNVAKRYCFELIPALVDVNRNAVTALARPKALLRTVGFAKSRLKEDSSCTGKEKAAIPFL
jgi:hypothetical protein